MNNNNTIISTMKIHNHWIVSKIQILNKNTLNNNILEQNNYNSDNEEYEYGEYEEYDNCKNCGINILITLLDYGLCEMCSARHKRKLQAFYKKYKKTKKIEDRK